MNVRLRVMTPQDIPEGMRLSQIAGWNQTPEDWERFLSASPLGCSVAEYGDRVIGTSASIIYGGELAWVGMVLVDPRFRGQGVGTALLERTIRYLDAHGIRCTRLDATPLGNPLYEKSGFVSEQEIERWVLHREPRRSSPPPAPRARIDIDDVLRLDREVFGADRSGLLRSLAEAVPDFAVVIRREGAVRGYSFGRRGALADHLGPWVALDRETAATLLDEFLARSQRSLVFVDCIPANAWVVPLLEARGFEFSRPLIQMCRGADAVTGRREFVGAVIGPEFG